MFLRLGYSAKKNKRMASSLCFRLTTFIGTGQRETHGVSYPPFSDSPDPASSACTARLWSDLGREATVIFQEQNFTNPGIAQHD